MIVGKGLGEGGERGMGRGVDAPTFDCMFLYGLLASFGPLGFPSPLTQNSLDNTLPCMFNVRDSS